VIPETVMADGDPNLDEHDQSPMAAAMQWVHRITTVVMEMVLPGIFGVWLDKKWGTNFIGLLGFALGLTTAITHLLQMTRLENAKSTSEHQSTVESTEQSDTPTE
jgi:hypothetical protein